MREALALRGPCASTFGVRALGDFLVALGLVALAEVGVAGASSSNIGCGSAASLRFWGDIADEKEIRSAAGITARAAGS